MNPDQSHNDISPALPKFYQVGGSIRDELLGFKPKDIDFAVEAESYQALKDHLIEQGYIIFTEKSEYLTIKAQVPKDHPLRQQLAHPTVDFTLCRTESTYSDALRPDEVKSATIEEDLSRRDFTVNALARSVTTGQVLDLYNGQQDATDKVLRCVRSASDRMRENPLRALRALRLMVTRDLQPDTELREALCSDWLPPLLATYLPKEMIQVELKRAFAHDSHRTLDLLYQIYSSAFRAVLFDQIWLNPTLAKKPKKI